ncbi:MAG: DUF342 domain-containing protein [Candidatus Helarchaeota archaeon]|nr:DUF342 domain-containing protein [Candidatus Helarchaeota archaeon]
MKINIEVSKDEKEARLTVIKDKDDEEIPLVEDLKVALIKAGVTVGIDESQLSLICFDQKFNEEFVVAKCIEPKVGKDAGIQEVNAPKPSEKIQPVVLKDGKIDYFAPREGFVVFTRKDDTIIKKVPPSAGEPGKSVLGKEIPGIKGKDISIIQFSGINTEVKDDSIIASIDGIVKFVDNRYVVEKEFKITTNVGLETGSIKIPRDSDVELIVDGDIKSGYEVTCPNLKVGGCVEDAKIDVKNLKITRGIVGTSDSVIKANVITVGYINGPRKVHANYIRVVREISNGAVITADIAQANIIQGSTVLAKEGIIVDHINGSNNVYIGIDYDVKNEFDELSKELNIVESEINEMKDESYQIAKRMVKLKQLAKINPKSPMLIKEMKKIKEFKEKLDSRVGHYNEIKEQKNKLADKMYHFKKNFLVVKSGFSTDTSSKQIIDPDTNLHICIHFKKIADPKPGGLFKADEREIHFFSNYNINEYKNIIENKIKSLS